MTTISQAGPIVPAKSTSFIIMPQNSVVFCWEVLIFIGILYYNLAPPFRLISQYNCDKANTRACLSEFHYSLILDYLFDLVFLVDAVSEEYRCIDI